MNPHEFMRACLACFKAGVLEDACGGIDLDGSPAKASADMGKAGVNWLKSADIAA